MAPRPRKRDSGHALPTAAMVLPRMTPAEFVMKWKAFAGNERSGYASHFDDLCDLLGHLKPAAADPTQQRFCFQRTVMQDVGRIGFADVYYEDKFGWEYKGNHKDLDSAYQQLLKYRANLKNPPFVGWSA